MQVDSLVLEQGTLFVSGADSSDYFVDHLRSRLYWHKRPVTDSVMLRYRVLALDFNRVFRHKNRSLVDSEYVFSALDDTRYRQSGTLVQYNALDYSGSYGRGISLGNNQDVVLNSNFNLQMNGYLLDSIRVEAAITDNAVPFQPEGNTANLQEFDQISIRLSKDRRSLMLGDYNLNRPEAYFLNFTKRVQGLFYQSDTRPDRRWSNKAGASFSVAKGEFARNIFNGTEGNQGPYRLNGNNGEQLFIVLAGTEKVYVDNVLQERGEHADYVFNYNTNELRFMPRRMITQNSRIQVEFEYRTNSYLNSLIFLYDELGINDKWSLRLNAYSNQDAKNQPFQQNLSGEQKRFLASIGDSIQNAYLAGISRDTFSAAKVLYEIRDTLVGTVRYDSVYVYSADASKPLFSVNFSYAGSGKGDYILSPGNANGRVYQWVPPVAGQRQGDYTAVTLIITPKMHQVITLGTIYRIDSLKRIRAELAASNRDPNLFSAIGDGHHLGMASKLVYEEERRWKGADSQVCWQLQNNISYEYVQHRFRAIAPFRPAEFGRDWNVPLSGISPDEHWATWSSSLKQDRLGLLKYAFSLYKRGMDYNGHRNEVGYTYTGKRISTGAEFSLMKATDSLLKYRFLKPRLFAEYRLCRQGSSVAGASYYAEHNTVTGRNTDTLYHSAFYFDISTVYLRLQQLRDRMNTGITFFRRRDFLPDQGAFQLQNHSDNIELQAALAQWAAHTIRFTGSYRQLRIDHTAVPGQKPEQTLLGRLEYTGSTGKNLFSFSTLYEFGSGQEQKRNFIYVQVPAGQGMYNWIDYNSDGIQQINEFVVALYPDQKLFIRMFTPGNEYTKVNNLSLNQTLSVDPAQLFDSRQPKGLKGWLARLSDQFSAQIVHKLLNGQGSAAYIPLTNSYQDTAVIIANTAVNNTLYFNRSSARWGLDYNLLHHTGKQLLSYGVTGTDHRQQLLKARVALSRSFTVNMIQRKGQRSSNSGIEDGSSYQQQYWSSEPALVWMKHSLLRITVALRYEERRNAAYFGGEQAFLSSASLETRYSQSATGIIQLRFTCSGITYTGIQAAPVSYVMLDGLKKGSNFLWYLNWQRRIGKGIELSMEYEGRKAAEDKIIHTGRMTLRAIL